MTRGRAAGGVAVRRGVAVAVLGVAAALAVSGCSGRGSSADPLTTAGPTTSAVAATSSPSPTDTFSPGSASPGSASPATGSPGAVPPGTASPDTATPGLGTSPGAGTSPSASGVQVTCTSVVVTGLGRTTVGPLRTTEIVTVVSDGRNLTPGTRQQTDFTAPALTAPGGGTISDAGTLQQVVNLLVGQRHRVLLERPPAPDEGVDATKRPYDSPGTYALYNASGLVTSEAVVQCAGQQQTWTFTAEGDPTTGQLNCVVEPPRGNGLARSVFAQAC